MFDIIPSNGGQEASSRRARPIRPDVVSRSENGKVVHAGPRVVQLQWKLPARLRKPIREQLQTERQQRKRRQAAAVSFARRPIRTQPLLIADEDSKRTGARVQKPRRFFNRGAEHHTGDIYAQGKPQLHVAAPPYIGNIIRKGSPPAAQPTPAPRPVRRSTPSRKIPVRQIPVNKRNPRSSRMPISERDVPVTWQAAGQPQASEEGLFVAVEKPKRLLPAITYSLWPGNWFGKNHPDQKDLAAFEATQLRPSGYAGLVAGPAKKKLLIS